MAEPISNKTRHDVKSACRTLDLLVGQLRKGYQFNDEFAAEKIKLVAEATSVLREFVNETLSAAEADAEVSD